MKSNLKSLKNWKNLLEYTLSIVGEKSHLDHLKCSLHIIMQLK